MLYFEMRDKPTGKPSYGALFPGVSPCGSGFKTVKAYFLTASPKMRRKFPPPIFPISSGVKPVFNIASTTT